MIAARAEALGDETPIEDFSPRKLRNYYLVNSEEDGERRLAELR